MRSVLAVLCLALFAGVLHAADRAAKQPDPDRFEIRPFAIEIPEWPDDLAGYELLTRSNRFQFAPPPNYMTRYDPARKMVMMTSRDGRCSIQFQVTTNFTKMPAADEALIEHVKRRVAGARNPVISTRVTDGKRAPLVSVDWGNPPNVQRTEYVVCVDRRYCIEFRVDMFFADVYALRNTVGNFFASILRTPLPEPPPRRPR